GVTRWGFAVLASAAVGLSLFDSRSAFGQPPGGGGRPSTQARVPPARNPGVWGRVVGPTNDGRFPGGHRPAGFLVPGLSSFGPAAAAGLERGDVVTRVNGRRILTYSDWVGALNSPFGGGYATFRVWNSRDGYPVNVYVYLGGYDYGYYGGP